MSDFANKKVLITGVTGFKGTWLAKWLLNLGAHVYGVGLKPDNNSLFYSSKVEEKIEYKKIDINEITPLNSYVKECQPDYVFHLAAQALVRASYESPVETYKTNLIGTVNMLEALRNINNNCVAIFVTTDKCYYNKEWDHSYREDDRLGGADPYSASKACCEIAINSYRETILPHYNNKIHLASARAGNVVGGGDWAKDRLIPDIMRSYINKEKLHIRYPNATRPWQHILDCLNGYITLAQKINENKNNANCETKFDSFNFGPFIENNQSVSEIVKKFKDQINIDVELSTTEKIYESSKLNLNCDKAYHRLGWLPKYNFTKTIDKTITFYKKVYINNYDASQMMEEQINEFSAIK